ncbi:hypothetical protein [Burkholderia ubonensis]|uniref:hypothetical protein n=1 Tax=Burkholderia ubonensis TaxID=101571 RepID=UPI0012F7AA6E|nr:hypothetical protein [Burkholderia ubonensis]
MPLSSDTDYSWTRQTPIGRAKPGKGGISGNRADDGAGTAGGARTGAPGPRRSAGDERIGAEAAGMVGAVRAPLRERRRRADVRNEGDQRAVRTAGTARTALESWILIKR